MLLTRRIAQLVIGLFLYGVALAMMMRAVVGVGPWDVLSQGISNHTGIPFGWTTNILGAIVLLLWIPLRQRPGIGTVANVLLLGTSAQIGLAFIPIQEGWMSQTLVFAAGLVLLALATGLYIGAGFGPGPRDGLMTGLNKRFGIPVWAARTAVEISVLIVGWLLGGNVGIGTLAFALLIGPMCNLTIPWFRLQVAPRVDRQGVAHKSGAGEPTVVLREPVVRDV